jgi:hypothetical protein
VKLNPEQFKLHNLGPGGHGADDYETGAGTAYRLEAPGGRLDFEHREEDRHLHIRWIESETKKQGVGRALINDVQRRFPGHSMGTSGFTPAGERFNEKLGHLIEEDDG